MAAERDGIVARRDLLAHGVDGRAIDRRLRRGGLHAVYPGVYAVGHRGEGERHALVAAWLYGGDRAVLTHRGACRYWGLEHFAQIDLTTPTTRSSRGSIVFHRGVVPAPQLVVRDGMRVATPARMMLELCAITPEPRMRRIYTEALVQGLVAVPAIEAILDANPGARGTLLLRSISGAGGGGYRDRARSRLELRFAALLEGGWYPIGRRNMIVRIGTDVYEADYVWPELGIVIEVDGRAAHDNPERFETDRERDRRLVAHGWRPVRVTDRQMREPARLRADLDLLFAAQPPPWIRRAELAPRGPGRQ
ncbi:MAG TPA: hypothetical protein VKA36_01560 [Solirubrobacterales bacterium]|nr:hypothetical protein [Solirubrobacterales bacterium]